MKKKFMLVFALILTLALVSCGEKKDTKPADATATATTVTTQAPAAKLDVAGYKKEVTRIGTAIGEASKPLTTLNPGDAAGAVKVYASVIEALTPLYKELSALEAPDSLKGAQEKLKAGSDASLEVLKLSAEMFDLVGNPAAAASADTMKKVQDLQTKLGDLQQKALGMQDAMVEINAAN
jgi:hypothetical protein